MTNIKIGDVMINNVEITNSNDQLLGLRFNTDMAMGEVETLFMPKNNPELCVVDENGNPLKLYKNRDLASLEMQYGENNNTAIVSLPVAEMKLDEVKVLATELTENTVAIAELGTLAANQETRAGETDLAIAELGILYADLLERVTALEAANVVEEENVDESVADDEVIMDETVVPETEDI